ncbi:MFS transporter [Acinetobacter baumannii]|uniref:MFS transporter n=1 Tax=Acinetobacter baumannii TaxID=470 RepID=UPI00234172AB|nr:MFS transporter [Acinetobacter baumannii]
MQNKHAKELSAPIILLMALACGLCTGSNYYSQPLLNSIAAEFGATKTSAAYISFIAQTLYTAGLFFLVPLGDIFDKKKIIVVFMGLAAGGQFICAFSNSLQMMYLGTAVSSLFSIGAQVLIPFSTTLVKPEHSAKVVGTLMSGLLMGILMARTVAGFLSTVVSWHMIYILSGLMLSFVSLLILLKLPSVKPQKIIYSQMLKTMYQLLKREPLLQKRSILGSLCFAGVSTVFTTMALVLAEPPYQFNDFQIGLVGLVGLVGVVLGPWAGQLFQKGLERKWSHYSIYLLVLSWVVLLGAQSHLLIYLAGLIIIYIGLSVLHILNQNAVYQIDPHSRSRLNSIYMTIYFSGAAFGSFCAIRIWHHWGWQGCCMFGLSMSLICLTVNSLWKVQEPVSSTAQSTRCDS